MVNILTRLMAILALVLSMSLGTPAESQAGQNSTGQTYGWSWMQPVVYVYDGTVDSPSWRVSEAVAEWNAPEDNLVLQITNDEASADIVVTETNTIPYVGVAEWTVNGGVASYCTVKLNVGYENTAISQHDTIHELFVSPDGTVDVLHVFK